MVKRQRMRGQPLSASEIAEIRTVAAKVLAECGFYNQSAIKRGVSFATDRATIAKIISQPEAAETPPLSDAQPPPDMYAAFLEWAKLHGIPIGNGIAPPAASAKPTAPALFTPKKFSRVAFISDVHLPFHNRIAVKITLDYLADYKPDLVILGGDIYDFLEASDFDKSPARITTLQDEFDDGREFIKAIDSLCPNVDFLIGNHEDRLQRLINRNPALFKLRSLDIAKAAELPEHWRVHPSQTHFRLGKLTALHGDIKGVKSAVHPARTLFQKLKRSCIFGHFHRFGNHMDTNYDGEVRGGFANGHLSDVSRVTSWVTCPDWQEGFSTISLCENGGFAVQQRLVMNGRLIAEGKEYTL